jgi:hypothetical protein
MRLTCLIAALCVLGACAPPAQVSKNRPPAEVGVGFGDPGAFGARMAPVGGSSLVRDFMDLTFALESGRQLETFSRFEGPVTVAMTGAVPPTAARDLGVLIGRLRSEAGIDIRPATGAAVITVEFTSRAELRRLAPSAACFVVPNVGSLAEYRRKRGSEAVDWAQVNRRERAAVFIPSDTSPQEVRDCLHEEIAQALGPLNDLYHLSDSVFNDDNFHTVLTGFDMLILRATYAPELRSGMTRPEVAARLPGILARLNPAGEALDYVPRPPTTRDWIDAVETALGPRTSPSRRRTAAAEAVEIARARGWNDNRLGFSLYALGRLSLGADPDLSLASFLQAGQIFSRSRDTAIHEAHISMQLAAFTLSAGQADLALDLADRSIPAVERAQNAALLSSLLFVKAEALELLGRRAEAQEVRVDSLGWARYGFGPDQDVLMRAAEIASLAPVRGEPS